MHCNAFKAHFKKNMRKKTHPYVHIQNVFIFSWCKDWSFVLFTQYFDNLVHKVLRLRPDIYIATGSHESEKSRCFNWKLYAIDHENIKCEQSTWEWFCCVCVSVCLWGVRDSQTHAYVYIILLYSWQLRPQHSIELQQGADDLNV